MAIAADETVVTARGGAAIEGVRAEAGNIGALDGLRGLSVTWIVLFHYTVLRDDPWAAAMREAPVLGPAIAQGPFAVDLFFLISGFLLTLPWLMRARDGRPAPDTMSFYRRRILRIVPAYYVNLFALFAVVMPLLYGVTYWRSDLYVYAGNAVAHALFLHNLSPLTSGSLGVNGALWTLAVEAQFYLLLPWMAPVFARAPWRSFAVAAAVSAAWLAGAHHGFDALVRWHVELGRHWGWQAETIRRLLAMQLPAYLFDFALGATLARAWLARAAIARWAPARTAAKAAALVFARGPLAFMGRISYSAYLWHLPLMLLLHVEFPLYAASVVAVGWVSWRCIERPFMQARGSGRAAPPPAPR